MSKLTPLFAPLRRGGTALARSINRVSTVRARIVFATLCVVAVAALAVTGYFTYQVRTQDQQRDDRAQALAAMRAGVPNLLSYNGNGDLKKEFAAKYDLLTGKFRNDFTNLTTSSIIPAATQHHIVTNAKIAEAGVISSTDDAVSVLMFINQTTTSTDDPTPKIDGSRIKITAVRSGDQWKIGGLQPV
ncbi:hypothetical protein [Gordonia polyisoprenivorans]|uniref:hypothetical protein n=1 Tax=Gordonia polyisoprenivorans TaxID=84595 RepID=UPI002300CCCB|nr:hypothetical protein [Gordonia polyisoprenivorans]WCB38904.1 hypothetical protein PHA63_07230 [Gordonia polyisoprenivorans]